MSQDSGDILQNYDVHEEIGRGASSIVYLATCKKGRMRNRTVALKKILLDTSHTHAGLAESAALHQSLVHPSIISLSSTFSTASARYEVLEYCANGSLWTYLQERQPPTLTEDELRGILKSLVAALVYLRNQRVVHRDIQPGNVLLTEDFRIKLSCFDNATRLSSDTSTLSTFCGSPNYVSPEMVSQKKYSFATDVWSLGALVVTCLTGVSAFEATTTAQIFTNITRGAYSLPENTSYELRDLVSGLLQLNPAHRIPHHRILCHPFFNPTQPIQPLAGNAARIPSTFRHPHLRAPPLAVVDPKNVVKYPSFLSKIPPTNCDTQHSSDTCTKTSNMRRIYSSDTWKPKLPPRHLQEDLRWPPGSEAGRRVVSAPESGYASMSSATSIRQGLNLHKQSGVTLRNGDSGAALATPPLTADSDSDGSSCDDLGSNADSELNSTTRSVRKVKTHISEHPLLLPPRKGRRDLCKLLDKESAFPQRRSQAVQQPPSLEPVQQVEPQLPLKRTLAPASSDKCVDPADRSTCVSRLNTAYLTPHTHKVNGGNVTVLPSLSLLVDLREGERRKGRKGNEVLVIAADGEDVKIHSAPHLSTPCCLAEPTAEYKVDDLPRVYHKQYDAAVKVVNGLKERIPKLVWHRPKARFTLMANEPFGDVEILFPPPESAAAGASLDAPQRQRTSRLRLLRSSRTLEISRYTSRGGGKATGEWTKQVFPVLGHGFAVKIPAEEYDGLDEVALDGLEMLGDFLRVCELIEGSPTGQVLAPDSAVLSTASSELGTKPSTAAPISQSPLSSEAPTSCFVKTFDYHREPRSSTALADKTNTHVMVHSAAATVGDASVSISTATVTGTSTVASMRVQPRPQKLNVRTASRTSAATPTSSKLSASPDVTVSSSSDVQEPRYVPSVGWCTKSWDAEAKRARYKVLLADGAAVDIVSAGGADVRDEYDGLRGGRPLRGRGGGVRPSEARLVECAFADTTASE